MSRAPWLALTLILVGVMIGWDGAAGAERGAERPPPDKAKAQIKIDIGLKARAAGKIEEAVEAFEDAYEANPSNVYPLLLWGETLCQVGMYKAAQKVLARIPLKSLPAAGQGHVHLLFARIHLAAGALTEAATALEATLAVHPENELARIRLAMVSDCLGRSDQARDLLDKVVLTSAVPSRERILVYLLDVRYGNFLRAWESIGLVARRLARWDGGEDGLPFGWSLLTGHLPFFFLTLPCGLGGWPGLIYALGLMAILVGLARHTSPKEGHRLDLGFVALALGHVGVAWWLGSDAARLGFLQDDTALADPIWIAPRLLMGIHQCTVALYLAYALFSTLPPAWHPARHELYGSWFFCWWFMVSVLVFQSRVEGGMRWGGLAASLLLTFGCALAMPLGRYLFLMVGDLVGWKGSRLLAAPTAGNGTIGFTDAKIMETTILQHLDLDEFDEAIALGRKLLAGTDRKGFPVAWLAVIRALIEREDYVEANQSLGEFLQTFQGSSVSISGQLLSAYYKSLTSDHAGALGIIQKLPPERMQGLSTNEAALSFLVLGRCNLAFEQPVQANLDLTKGLSLAKNPLTAAKILCELVELEVSMERLEPALKWFGQAQSLKGGKKTSGLVKTIESMVVLLQGKPEVALALAQDACRTFPKTSRSWAWLGHLLCLRQQFDEAEKLLEKMAPGSSDAEKLMGEITRKGR
jgi:tetratricopeptide (TPR) repeat protein